ncbi:MAG TPA: polyphosphate polymerase domain-containing protein, partial [Micromonosporaceae bacterium]|nr:polyphosphate polymerase domain-containing protein [Micromonosporaceae bacterium]
MSAYGPCCQVWHLPPIGLDELMEVAALQTRMDRKYVLPVDTADALLTGLAPDEARVLEIGPARVFAYESVYFDTPELTSYLLAARRRRRRFKVRTRAYLDSAECWLEVKTRGPRGSTVKNRLPYAPEQHASLGPGREFVDTVLAAEAIADCRALAFAVTLTSRYRRRTLYLPATGARVTVDTELTWQDPCGNRLRLPGLAIVETKTGSTASEFDRMLWSRGHRPIRISKYAT